MNSFLEKTVQHLYAKYGNNIDELCIVLPNRRAGLFLKTHFARYLQKTFWSPDIYAIEDFVALLSGLETADTTTLLFELYETIKHLNQSETEGFDEFSKWGQIFLNDINEIDRYLVDAGQLFGNLKDIKELETWSLNKEEQLTDFQKKYLEFWKSLGAYYTAFHHRLLSKNRAYQGLTYRVTASDTLEKVNKFQWKKIIFAGFNALNKAEEEIIAKLLAENKAEIIWDTDNYYVNDTRQEAGRFIRKYLQSPRFTRTSEANQVIAENLFTEASKYITIIGAAKNIAQAKVAGNILSTLQQQNISMQDTALVLADENLLFPVLHSLPESLTDINVTMGYPLKNTPVAGFFDLVFDLHINAIKLNPDRKKYSFYHKDILKLLNHPYTLVLLQDTNNRYSVKPIVKIFQERNIVFAALSTLESIIEENQPAALPLLKPVFDYWQQPSDAINCIYNLIEALKDAIVKQQNNVAKNNASLELEYLFAITKITKQIQVLMQDYPDTVKDVQTLHTLYKQIVKNSTLPFYGEPLMGLQVMGMLETRTLDFENIILLSCNEDILPAGKSMNSFIPHELKRYFGLPTYADKDAVFAYHFYRLLQRASNIYLLYNTESDALGSGERSRFLTQLAYELPKINSNIVIEEKLVSLPVEVQAAGNIITIKKDAAVMERLQHIAAFGLSPSALNKYRNCPLQFYFHSIAGLKEADEIEETIGADVLGNAIHEVLETLYKPFVGKKINAADIKEFKTQVETLTIAVFEKQYSKTEINYGKNLLTVKIAIKFINNFLDTEIRTVDEFSRMRESLFIKALEQPLETTLDINNHKIKLIGKADRIDVVNNTTRIIDYKTGIATDKELRIESWEEIQSDSNLAKSFQLLMYALLYHKMNPQITSDILSGIITFRQLSAGLKTVKINTEELLSAQLLTDFETQLQLMLADLYNNENDFSQTQNIENCEYCSFKGICNR